MQILKAQKAAWVECLFALLGSAHVKAAHTLNVGEVDPSSKIHLFDIRTKWGDRGLNSSVWTKLQLPIHNFVLEFGRYEFGTKLLMVESKYAFQNSKQSLGGNPIKEIAIKKIKLVPNSMNSILLYINNCIFKI